MIEIPEEVRKELEQLPPKFWGSVEITYQAGQPLLVKTIRTKKILPNEQERNNRHDNYSA